MAEDPKSEASEADAARTDAKGKRLRLASLAVSGLWWRGRRQRSEDRTATGHELYEAGGLHGRGSRCIPADSGAARLDTAVWRIDDWNWNTGRYGRGSCP